MLIHVKIVHLLMISNDYYIHQNNNVKINYLEIKINA